MNNNNNSKKTDSFRTAMILLLVLGVLFIDVSLVLTVIFIFAAAVLPFIKKTRETGEKIDLTDLGGTAKKVLEEAKHYAKEAFNIELGSDGDDEDEDEDEEDGDGDEDDGSTLADQLFGKKDKAPEPGPCYTGTEFDTPDEGSPLKRMTERAKEEEVSDCAPDHEHVEPDYNMSPDEKRREQLNNMLKNGIIDKKEYKILLKKFGLK